MLIRETPGDEEVGRALFEAKIQLKKQRGEDIKDMEFGSNLVFISNNERFRHFVTSPGNLNTLYISSPWSLHAISASLQPNELIHFFFRKRQVT